MSGGVENGILSGKAYKSVMYCDGATGARRLVGARPVEQAVDGNCV